jgi:hypothetical protein
MRDDGFQGFRCICGEEVVTMHKECKAMMTVEDQREYERGRLP